MDGNVMEMSLQARGAYITLLCLCWLEQQLPLELPRLAHRLGVPTKVLAKLWPAVGVCFTEVDGHLVHKRLDKERDKQAAFRADKAAAGRWSVKGAARVGGKFAQRHQQPLVNTPTVVGEHHQQPTNSPPTGAPTGHQQATNSPISDLRTTYSSDPSDPQRPPPSSRSKRPIFRGQRITVFDWMLDDCLKTLGTYAEPFDLHAWFFDLDEQARRTDLVIPQRDGGAWLQQQLLAEATRRGLPIASSLGKFSTRMARALATIEAETRAERATQGPSVTLGHAKGRE